MNEVATKERLHFTWAVNVVSFEMEKVKAIQEIRDNR